MTVQVYVDRTNEPLFVGRLYVHDRGPSVTFEYADEWLKRNPNFSIDPVLLPLGPGKFHGKTLFGAIQDCGPDRWGRLLIDRAVRKGLLKQKPFRDTDYVLQLDDCSRIGALRFRIDANGPFLAPTANKLPPIIELAALKRAADAVNSDSETATDLKFLLGQGSPLGGARPKSAVRLKNGNLGIAKFPKPDDIRDVAAGEILGLQLARQAGIDVTEHELVPLEDYSVAVITRFDRDGENRIPFISGASLLGLGPGQFGSYAELADAIRQYGDNHASDLKQLWRRMVFSLLASNYDDHMRNHGFLMRADGRWALSPAYDINPVPEIDRSDVNKTPISDETTESSIAEALRIGPRFGLQEVECRSILTEVFSAVNNWHDVAKHLQLSGAAIEAYSSAFDSKMTEEAKKILG